MVTGRIANLPAAGPHDRSRSPSSPHPRPSPQLPILPRRRHFRPASRCSSDPPQTGRHPFPTPIEPLQQRRQIQVRIQLRKMYSVPRRRNLDLLQLRRTRPLQPLCPLRQKSHFQSRTQPDHHASRSPVISRSQRLRHVRLQFQPSLVRPPELLLKSHESVSIPGRDTRPRPATPLGSAVSPAARIRNSPPLPPAPRGSATGTSLHIHVPQRGRVPGDDHSCKSEHPALEIPAPLA